MNSAAYAQRQSFIKRSPPVITEESVTEVSTSQSPFRVGPPAGSEHQCSGWTPGSRKSPYRHGTVIEMSKLGEKGGCSNCKKRRKCPDRGGYGSWCAAHIRDKDQPDVL